MDASAIHQLFKQTIHLYHVTESPADTFPSASQTDELSQLLVQKNWIDCLQWHLEDKIRIPDLPLHVFVETKREIDRLNQQRTNIVEEIDAFLFHQFSNITRQADATFNSETPAWLLDRMSILQLKIYHFEELIAVSNDKSLEEKLFILQEQEHDLGISYNALMNDLQRGKKYIKLYKQMKMYNDPAYRISTTKRK